MPGFKARDTSKAAAESARHRAVALRNAVLKTIADSAGLTADEVAEKLGESILAIRPRVSELGAQFKITDSGYRRRNDSGRNAIVWVGA
jgi:predicted ArsR family transcriptional regulator